LQEVDSRRDKHHGINPFEFLQPRSASTASGQNRSHGGWRLCQMLISRWPMRDTIIHDLSIRSASRAARSPA